MKMIPQLSSASAEIACRSLLRASQLFVGADLQALRRTEENGVICVSHQVENHVVWEITDARNIRINDNSEIIQKINDYTDIIYNFRTTF